MEKRKQFCCELICYDVIESRLTKYLLASNSHTKIKKNKKNFDYSKNCSD